MNIVVSREELNQAIAMVQRAISTRSPLAILEGILIEAREDQLILTGYDLQKAIVSTIPATVKEGGKLILRSRLFADIVRMLPEERVTIVRGHHGPVQITAGKAKYEIDYLDGDYPELPEVQRENHLEISQNTLREMVNKTIFSASSDPSRPILNGLNVRFSPGELQVVAIDGFRMARQKALVENNQESRELNIPSQALQELVRVLDKSDETVDIYSTDQYILFDNGKVKLVSRLLNGNYIDYKDIVPKQYMSTIRIDSAALLAAIERCSLVINIEMKRDPITLKSLNQDVLQIMARTDIGTAEEELLCHLEGEEIDIDFNPRYLMEALRLLPASEIQLGFGGNGTSLVIEGIEDDSFLYLILPVRR